MFGYITLAQEDVPQNRLERYRSFYCGICYSLGQRLGAVSRFTLSNDLTFLALLLESLYEPAAREITERCLPHPFRPHKIHLSPVIDYCADMNLILAYHKAQDNKADEKGCSGTIETALLKKPYEKVLSRYPEKCAVIEQTLKDLALLERAPSPSLDALLNLSGKMLGAVYTYRNDEWTSILADIGKGLGRFVYLMDAYEDLKGDIRHGRFNPLKSYQSEENYEDFIKNSLTLLISESAELFEILPLENDLDLLRNVLYAGCWSKYEQIRAKISTTPVSRKGGIL